MRLLPVVIVLLMCVVWTGCASSDSPSAKTVKRASTSSRHPARAAGRAAPPAPPMTVAARLTPAKTGSPARPQPVVLDMRIGVGRQPAVDPPPIDSMDIVFPAGTRYNGSEFTSCAADALARQGLAACPAASVMGTGRAIALADTAITEAKLTIVNGGAGRVLFYTSMDAPARVRAASVGALAKLSGGAYRMHVVIPRELQTVAGVPLYLRSLRLHAGRGNWLETTGCPPTGRWLVRATAQFQDGSRRSRATRVPCG